MDSASWTSTGPAFGSLQHSVDAFLADCTTLSAGQSPHIIGFESKLLLCHPAYEATRRAGRKVLTN